MLAIEPDYDRFVETHEPHYFHAQARGFALIRKIERYLKSANSYAGRYYGYTDHETGDVVITGECDEEYEAEWNKACDLARMAARSNAYWIIRAQGRDDEAAMLIHEAHRLIAQRG
ncbi:hypothetical protein [Sphingobium sp. TCM1]|uniref:hypothetical protein n=1 Tax=Sphingobium sp. TCM1 TaxID=453246 RepID=UPI0007F442D9|nr:hypothetical protein [Sphingobium sp. TCM1]OAN58681.1 hypothetical protein A7Q26_13670 [Sphingobium sp. TCM1]